MRGDPRINKDFFMCLGLPRQLLLKLQLARNGGRGGDIVCRLGPWKKDGKIRYEKIFDVLNPCCIL